MGDDYAWVKIVGIFALFGVVLIGFLHANMRRKIRNRTEAEEAANAIADGVANGLLDSDGRRLCKIGCGEPATHFAVCTGRSWIDSIPILSSFNRLYGMPWRYTVVEVEGELYYCLAHRRAAEQRLEQAHATMRGEHSAFNHTQEQKIAMLEQGGLDQLLREDSDRIKRSIGLRGSISRVLNPLLTPTGESEEVHVLPVRTTNAEGESNEN